MPNESPDPKFATVGAVYDRPYFVESRKNGRVIDRPYSQSIFFRWAKPNLTLAVLDLEFDP